MNYLAVLSKELLPIPFDNSVVSVMVEMGIRFGAGEAAKEEQGVAMDASGSTSITLASDLTRLTRLTHLSSTNLTCCKVRTVTTLKIQKGGSFDICGHPHCQ